MSLTFLSPWVLVGFASLAVPVVIHLIFKRKPKPLLFPAFRFLRERRKTNQRKLQLRHLLLLALRLLLLAALVAALARPLLTGGPSELAGNPDLGMVLIFDSSVSMNYVQDGVARLDLAKDLGTRLIDNLPLGSQVAVLDSGEQGGQFLSPRDARRLVQARRILPRNRPVTATVEEAWRLLEKSAPKLPLLVCVFSDRTAASWDPEAASMLTKLPALEEKLQRKLEVLYFDLGSTEPRNVGIAGLALRAGAGAATPLEEVRLGAPSRVPVQLQAVLEVTGPATKNELQLFLDGKLVDQQAVELAAEPGQQSKRTVTFKPMTFPHSVQSGEVRLRSRDALEDDNQRSYTLTVSRRKVLIIADNPNDALDWKIALEALEDKLPVECTVVRPAEVPAALVPEQYQATCLFAVQRPTAGLWDTLNRYVTAGGGLVLLPGVDADPAAWNSDAALALTPGRLKAPRAAGGTGAFMVPDYEHPMMNRFKVWEQPITPAIVQRYWEVVPIPQQSQVLAEYSDGSRPALLERVFDRTKVLGRVLLFTTPMYRRTSRDWKDWNNFLEESGGAGWIALALPYLSIEHVLGARGEPTNFLLGEDLRFLLPTGQKLLEYKLTGPQNGTGKIPEKSTSVLLTDLAKPGNYQIADPTGKLWSASFSLNLPARETQLLLNRPEPAALEGVFGEGCVQTWADDLDLNQLVREKFGVAQETDLLPWLMVLCLLFLALENLLANRFYREDTREEGP